MARLPPSEAGSGSGAFEDPPSGGTAGGGTTGSASGAASGRGTPDPRSEITLPWAGRRERSTARALFPATSGAGASAEYGPGGRGRGEVEMELRGAGSGSRSSGSARGSARGSPPPGAAAAAAGAGTPDSRSEGERGRDPGGEAVGFIPSGPPKAAPRPGPRPAGAFVSRVGGVRAQVEQVQAAMSRNIAAIMSRGENLQSVETKSAALAESAEAFRTRSRVLLRRMWWANAKCAFIAFGVALLLGLIIFLAVCRGLTCVGVSFRSRGH